MGDGEAPGGEPEGVPERLAALEEERLRPRGEGKPELALRVLRQEDGLLAERGVGRLGRGREREVGGPLVVELEEALAEDGAVGRDEEGLRRRPHGVARRPERLEARRGPGEGVSLPEEERLPAPELARQARLLRADPLRRVFASARRSGWLSRRR